MSPYNSLRNFTVKAYLTVPSGCFSQSTIAKLNIGCLLSSPSSAIRNVPTAHIPTSLSRNPLSSNVPITLTFAHELAQAMLVYLKIPIKLAMKTSRIDIAADPLPLDFLCYCQA
jgi:hypothetical protein